MRTYLDLIDRLRAYVGNDGNDLKSAAVIRAAALAVEGISQKASWNYYRRPGLIVTNTPYETGTVAIDVTGGAYERMVTLSGGTWPSWAALGTVSIDNVPYDVDRRISDTVLTLQEWSSPTSDVAAGTEYQLYQTRYDLPTDFVAMHKPVINSEYVKLNYVTYDTFLTRRNFNDGVGQPSIFTVIDNGYGRKQIQMWNPPDTVYSLQYEYKRKPVLPVIIDEQRGKVSLTGSSSTVTGTSTLFSQAMAGGVLRVSYDQTVPSSYDSINPPQYEYLIQTITNTTTLDLREAATATAANRAYVISSRLDVADGPMFAYLCQMGYRELRMNLRINMTNEEKEVYDRVRREAIDADGQNYSGSDRAVVAQCQPGYFPYGSYTRQIPGNG